MPWYIKIQAMDTLWSLEQLSRQLELNDEERSVILNEVAAYTNAYINSLEHLDGFGSSEFQKLGMLTIEDRGKPISVLLEVLKQEVDIAGISSASGRHLGFIPGGGLWTSAIADFIADVTNKYTGIAFSGPGNVKMENQVIRWLCDLVHYPSNAFGNLTSGGSTANLIAIKAARDSHGIHSTNVRTAVIYCGEQTHHSVYKALHTTGLHECVVRKIPLNDLFQIDIAHLKQQLNDDSNEGLNPFLIIGSAGTTDTGAIDPLSELADLASAYKAWFHVDAAYGGFFMLVDEMQDKLKGIERSDSVVLDPHKTLFLPFGSGAVLLRDVNALLSSNSSHASYLTDTHGTADISPADTGIELSRPNRGLRMWLPLQLHGVAAFKVCLREKIVLTDYFFKKISTLGFETGPYPQLTVVKFRYPEEGNIINQKLIHAIHQDGRVFLSSTVIQGKTWLRCAIVSNRTHQKEIDLALKMIADNLERITG